MTAECAGPNAFLGALGVLGGKWFLIYGLNHNDASTERIGTNGTSGVRNGVK